MSTAIGSLAVMITGNTSGLATSLKTSESLVKKFEKDVAKGPGRGAGSGGGGGGLGRGLASSLTTGLSAGLGAVGGMGAMSLAGSLGAGLADFVTGSIGIAAEFEDAQATFKILLGDAEKAKGLFGDIKKFAAETPLTTRDMTSTAQNLLAVGIKADQIIPSLRVLGDLAQGDNEKLTRLAMVYGQIRSAGRLTADNYRQLTEQQLGGLGTMIAKQKGFDTSEFRDQMEQGKISFSDLQRAMKAMTSEGGSHFNMLAERAKTFNGLLSTLRDNWDMFRGKLGDMIIEEFGLKTFIGQLADGLQGAGNHLEGFRPVLKELAGLSKMLARDLFEGAFGFARFVAKAKDDLGDISNGYSKAKMFLMQGAGFQMLEPMAVAAGIVSTDSPAKTSSEAAVVLMRAEFERSFGMIGKALGGAAANEIGKAAPMFGGALAGAIRGAMREFEIEQDKVRNEDMKKFRELKDQADPIAAMRKELDNLEAMKGRGAFTEVWQQDNGDGTGQGGEIPRDDLFALAVADVFDKFAKDIDGSAKLASAALKGSAEAVSAIARHRSGADDPQRNVAAILQQMKDMQAQKLQRAVELLQQLNDGKGNGPGIKPLRP